MHTRYGLLTEATRESKFLIKPQGNGWALGVAASEKTALILSGIVHTVHTEVVGEKVGALPPTGIVTDYEEFKSVYN